MADQEAVMPTAIPDLKDLPLGRLRVEGDSALARALQIYRKQIADSGVPLSSFQARI